MAHELFIDATGNASMAYIGDTPWHGLGSQLEPRQPLEVWLKAAGMNYTIESSPVEFRSEDANEVPSTESHVFEGKRVLYRGDNHVPLSIVSDRYKVVQPVEVLEFFRNLTTEHGWVLDTAGVLYSGQKYWALAKTGEEVRVKGQDLLKGYVLLATSCDGTLRTVAKHTSVRVVCNNTLTWAANGGDGIKVSHSTQFDATKVQTELGIGSAWDIFTGNVAIMADCRVSRQEALNYVIKIFGDPLMPVEQQPAINTIAKVLQLFDGNGKGSDLASSRNTAWGLVQAVTEYVDWHKGANMSRRLDSAWFGKGETVKQEAFEEALKLAA